MSNKDSVAAKALTLLKQSSLSAFSQHLHQDLLIASLMQNPEALPAFTSLLRKRYLQLNSIIESSHDGLYVVDKVGQVIFVNSAWEQICGFSQKQIIGQNVRTLLKAGLYNNSAALTAMKNKKTSTITLETTAGTKKGQKILATGTPVFSKNGQLEFVVVNVRDITELEMLQEQLKQTRELSNNYAEELQKIRCCQANMQDIVAKSPAMQHVLDLALRVSQVDSTVLITGESGVGKEIIAQKIHQWSARRTGSLIKINCGAIPENLLETELFGYEGGSFTGASSKGKPGLFELASGGTLFLDEIGDLPLNLQVKILRALQDQEIVRVGGIQSIHINTRILAATNKKLSQMIGDGSFRDDLYYRLNVINIDIPPLRSRKEDLSPLIQLILRKINTKYDLSKSLSPAVVESLYHYNWPGNIRELENVLERMSILSPQDVIQFEYLPDALKVQPQHPQTLIRDSSLSLREIVRETEIRIIKKALYEMGTTRKAAAVLQINQSTLVRKMQQYQIPATRSLDAKSTQIDSFSHHNK